MNREEIYHITELEDQITELRVQVQNQDRKLTAVAELLEAWKGYCMENGGQTYRLMEEVTDLLNGRAVFAGTKLIEP